MSGICGVFSSGNPAQASPEILDRLMTAINHRGGDGEARFIDPANGLAIGHLFRATFARPGEQPLPALVEDGNVVAALEGSISNLQGLFAADLASQSNQDAQALIKLYRQDQTTFPDRLRGYFALVLWDGTSQTLNLAEDPMGRSPLYYYQDPARHLLVFASELKGVLAHPEVPRNLDHDALSAYLGIGDVPAPLTLFAGIRKLESGQHLTFSRSGESKQRRASPFTPQPKGPDRIEPWLPLVRQEVESAVARTTSSAQRVGVFLSGGIDSAALLAAAKAQGSSEVKAFTIVDSGGSSTYDLPWAEKVAASVGSPHEVLTIDQSDVRPDLVANVFRQMDEPFESAMRAVTHNLLLGSAKQAGYDSLLVGSGAELHFSGLRRWRVFHAENPGDLDRQKALFDSLSKPPYLSFAEQLAVLTQPPAADPLISITASQLQPLAGFELLDALLLGYLTRNWMSRMGMFNVLMPPLTGQQTRSPFYEEGLTQFGLSIPPTLKGSENGAMSKILLRRAYETELEMSFDGREKRALPGVPRPAWLEKALVTGLQRLGQSGIVKPDYANRLAVRYQRGSAQKHAMLLFVLHCWLEQYLFQREPFAEFLD